MIKPNPAALAAPAKVNPLAELPVRDGDIELSDAGLLEISFLSRLTKARKEKILKYPGAMRLRRLRPTQVICEQNEPGSTAYYILRARDWQRVLAFLSRDGERLSGSARDMQAMLDALPADRRERLDKALQADQDLEKRRQQVQSRLEGRTAGEAALKKLQTEADKAKNKERSDKIKKLLAASPDEKRKEALAIKDADPDLAKLLFETAISADDVKKFQEQEEFLRTSDAEEKRGRGREIAAKDPTFAALLRASAEGEEALPAYAEVRLATGREQARPTGLFTRVKNWFLGKRERQADEGPSSLPADGPTELDFRTRRANLFEGDLFGEMACLTRQPRSATVTALRDGFVLEILSNVLEEIDEDPDYKKDRERIYRRRVLQLHLRDLALFRDLSTAEYTRVIEQIRDKVELVTFNSGQVICDEHERSDAIYLVREGMVQVIKGVSALVSPPEVKNWTKLAEKFKTPAGPVAGIAKQLPPALVKALGEAGAAGPDEATARDTLAALNDLIKSPKLLTLPEIKPVLESERFKQRSFYLPADRKDWSESHQRRGSRLVLEEAFGDALAALDVPDPNGDAILRYLGRGDIFGEIGVVQNVPRTATCIAYGQPRLRAKQKKLGEAELGQVELVRISEELVRSLMNNYPVVRESLSRVIESRRDKPAVKAPPQKPGVGIDKPGQVTAEAARLGLVQGQKLMLIDLERCTRCDECVNACVDSHDDGRTRLFLTGPRFGKYLVPFTCRSCLDPVCMIGCPVRSIQRGDNLEIQIKDWCIGCGICANNCPYSSIAIHPLLPGEEPAAPEGKDLVKIKGRAVVCDMCSTLADQKPRCVYACPHEAAMRVEFSGEFLGMK